MSPAAISPGLGAPDLYALGLLFAGLAVLVAILALTHQRPRAYSASIVYLAMGGVGAAGIAVLDAPWLDLMEDSETVERMSELAVIVALFATGLRLDRRLTWRAWRSTALLLAVVMPLTIAAVAAFGALGMGLSAGAAIVLGAALAPTDPVLAGELGVGPPGERDETEPAFALTSEAGLNDGLAFPFLLLGLVVAGGASPSDVARVARGGRRLRDRRGHRDRRGRPAGRCRPARHGCASAASSTGSSTAGPPSGPCSPSTG